MSLGREIWKSTRGIILALRGSLRDLIPIVVVVVAFQALVLRQPLPDAFQLIFGMCLVLLGLTLFIRGLELALFPIGEGMAYAFARRGSLFWLLLFAFCLGFGTTIAEPALIAIADEAARIAAQEGAVAATVDARASYAWGLRLTVAFAVGLAIIIGVIRIIRGWPVHWLVIGGYVAVVTVTLFAPPQIVGIAYDLGGVTTSTITVPLLAALGVGLASSIEGRNPLSDGFGLIALAALSPMVFVMFYGMVF